MLAPTSAGCVTKVLVQVVVEFAGIDTEPQVPCVVARLPLMSTAPEKAVNGL